MKKILVGPLLFAFALVPALSAQTETFDSVSFVRPAGFNRTEPNGILLLQNNRKIAGLVQHCQIFVFPAVATNAGPAVNFQMEWNQKIAGTMRIAAQPTPQSEATSEGWIAVTGFADVMIENQPTRVVLTTATGTGKEVTILVSVSANAYQQELEAFYRDMNLSPGTPGAGSAQPPANQAANRGPDPGASNSLANYLFTPPQSWTQQTAADRIVLVSPMYDNGERCQLTLLPMRPSSQALPDDAIGTFRQIFGADPLTSYPSPPPRLARGDSPQGWEYFSIRKLVGGQEGEARTIGATLLLANIDGQIATIVGTSKDFLWSKCFGELNGDAWPTFFYGLRFRNAQPAKDAQQAIRQRLAGEWIAATANVGLHYTFLANGRYQGVAAAQNRSSISDTQDLQTTRAYFGDGSYAFDGNTIVLTGDDHRRSAQSFRLEQVSKNSGQSWSEELCLMDPGATGEVCYRKQ
jgi:hypothetical protein